MDESQHVRLRLHLLGQPLGQRPHLADSECATEERAGSEWNDCISRACLQLG